MLKAVFRPGELVTLPDKISIDSPTSYPDLAHFKPVEDEADELAEVEEYTGPTADDLRREAELFKRNWEEEKERMILDAKAEAERIIDDAQRAAFQEVKRQTDDAQVLKQQAEDEAQRIINEARNNALDIEREIRNSLDTERKEFLEKSREEGREAGFTDGKAEVERLIERTQVVLERAQEKRGEIIAQSEQEIIDLVLLIARKVVKVISENQRDVIISNVIEALRKVKAKGSVIIRVNINDLQLATDHKQDFIKLLEGAKNLNLQVVEDSTVDQGGCIIETDFGEIDARIASQLAEIENRILGISPLKSTTAVGEIDRPGNIEADLAAIPHLLDSLEKNNAGKRTAPYTPQPAPSAPSVPSAGTPGGGNPFANIKADDLEDSEKAAITNAALTASAAMAAIATLGMKGKRESDKDLIKRINKGIMPPGVNPEEN